MSELRESGEMYLETILVLSQKLKKVRSIDVAEEMNYSKPSVSRGIKILKEQKHITVEDSGEIVLTETGLEIANRIYERHLIISKFLESIGVDKDIAAEDACRMEHIISAESFEALKKYAKSNNLI